MVLSATTPQKNSLTGSYGRGNKLAFIEDANGNWVVNQSVVTDDDFLSIRAQLEALPVIEYAAKPNPQGI